MRTYLTLSQSRTYMHRYLETLKLGSHSNPYPISRPVLKSPASVSYTAKGFSFFYSHLVGNGIGKLNESYRIESNGDRSEI